MYISIDFVETNNKNHITMDSSEKMMCLVIVVSYDLLMVLSLVYLCAILDLLKLSNKMELKQIFAFWELQELE